MSSRLTPERIAEMQKWLLEHPIDHEYDEMCDMLDSPAPPAQCEFSERMKKWG